MKNEYVICQDYVIGKTKSGIEYYFDIDDFDIVKQFDWILLHNNICTSVDNHKRMQELILGYSNIKHLNGNNFDNRKCNLVPVRGFKNGTNLNGYTIIYKPEHPKAYNNGCVYEHILVAEQKLGRYLKENECVHHIDGNRSNNNPDNIMVFKSQSDHAKYHKGYNAVIDDDGVYSCI